MFTKFCPNLTYSCARLLLISITSLLVISCEEEGIDPIQGQSGQSFWKQAAHDKPVLHAGQEREKSIWNDPSVIKDGSHYVMYLTTSTGKPFEHPVLPFRAESKNGKDWSLNPETPLLTAEGTPFVSIETPSVVKFRGTYHMFYTGIYPAGQVPTMAIGHATSKDGIRWQHNKAPAISATGKPTEWNGFLVAEPGAVVYNNKIYVYYTAMGARQAFPPQIQTIALVTTTDGQKFSAQQKLFGQTDRYPPEKGFVGYSTPSALVHKNHVHLVYDVAAFVKGGNPEWQQVAIHHAKSRDGVTNFEQDPDPILTRSDFEWTDGEILAPTMLISGDRLKLWFAGHVSYGKLPGFMLRGMKGPEFGIGYAELPLSTLEKHGFQ